MYIFYNIAGLVIGLMAILMLRFGLSAGESRPEFKTASRVLHITYLLTALSIFLSQFEPKIASSQFQMLNPLIILFFYIVSQGFIYTFLILYKSSLVSGYLKRTIPILVGFGLYTITYFIFGDPSVYSAAELWQRLPQEPMLMFRCALFVGSFVSICIGLKLSYNAGFAYNKRMAASFSEDDFQFSIMISRFMWSVKALAVWVVLTYFYTSPVLEAVSCSLITLVFAFQLIGFRDYMHRRKSKVATALTMLGEINFEVAQEQDIRDRIRVWTLRDDKPFTKAGLSIVDMAKEIGVPKTKLSTYINEMGDNYCSWINSLRIEEAKHLLALRRELSVSEVAEATGFCDLPAFSRAFKRATGVSPLSFRRSAVAKTLEHS